MFVAGFNGFCLILHIMRVPTYVYTLLSESRMNKTVIYALSGCGQCHETQEVVPKKLWVRFPLLALSRTRNTSQRKTSSEWRMAVNS